MRGALSQKAPPLAGELSNEVRLRGNIAWHSCFEPFPFRHGLRRDTFPVNGDSF